MNIKMVKGFPEECGSYLVRVKSNHTYYQVMAFVAEGVTSLKKGENEKVTHHINLEDIEGLISKNETI